MERVARLLHVNEKNVTVLVALVVVAFGILSALIFKSQDIVDRFIDRSEPMRKVQTEQKAMRFNSKIMMANMKTTNRNLNALCKKMGIIPAPVEVILVDEAKEGDGE